MARVVLDTNVLVSGVIASGHSARILDSARQNKITLVTSPHLLAEFNDVISRRRITRKYSDAAVDLKYCWILCALHVSSSLGFRKEKVQAEIRTMILSLLVLLTVKPITSFLAIRIYWT